ncbi:hypothetical protein [Actinocatenispora sera]|uniref:Uncharacterized protein n=1 Tax=Actinocatenispora sera TaxID=390989 RepID=A0A810KUU5_9ACTN|nr:hypothetical protein [Actinocatenispora sera]BCJ26940.1 hypothetical protein Asera_10480 [Actinocatenispora sera]
MSRSTGAKARYPAKPDPTITGAKIALIGAIAAALIGAASTITVALVQRRGSEAAPGSVGASPSDRSTASRTPTAGTTRAGPAEPSAASPSATGTAPDGVTYRCTGSAPTGIDISYGPSTGGSQATSLPFTAHERLTASARYYSITAQLAGSGHVSCTITLTDAGRTVSASGTARGGYNSARPQICAGLDAHRWNTCT